MEDVQAYSFGSADAQPPVMLSGLERLGEKLCRRLRVALEPIIGSRAQLTLVPAMVNSYAQWSAEVADFVSISLYRVSPLKGVVALRMNPEMIAGLVDCFYGGTGTRPAPKRREFTPTEDRLIGRLADGVIENLVDAWSETLAMEAVLTAREASLAHAGIAQADEPMLVQRFELGIGTGVKWPIDILIPVAALRSVEPLFENKVHDEARIVDPVWQTRLGRRLGDVSLPARTVLARPNLTLAELMQLKEGDVIPVTIGRNLPLIVGNRVVAHGTVGEQNGRAAFMIEKLAQGIDQ